MSRGNAFGPVRPLALALAITALVACDGSIRGAEDDSPARGVDAFVCQDPNAITLGSSPVRRLTNVEYDNTIRDLLGGNLPPLPEQPSDAVLEGSFENDALSLGPSDVRITRYETAALSLGEHAVGDATARGRVLPCSTADADCGREFVLSFGKRAFRRPLTDDEHSRWVNFFESQRVAIDFDAAVQLTVAAMLQSPQFLYRLENDANVIAGSGGGYFRPGRYVHYPQSNLQVDWGGTAQVGPAHERLNVSLMHAMGMTERRSFGLDQVSIGGQTFSLLDPLPRLT